MLMCKTGRVTALLIRVFLPKMKVANLTIWKKLSEIQKYVVHALVHAFHPEKMIWFNYF